MVEVVGEKTTAEVVSTIDPEGRRSLLANLQAIDPRNCHPDDLKALYERPQPRKLIISSPVLTAA